MPGYAKQVATDKPNVLFILVDDLGYSDVSYMNYKSGIHTPNIDKLADTGVIFTNAYAACPVCSPTRASILTGKYPATLKLTCHIPGMGMEKYLNKLKKGKPLQEAYFRDHLPTGEITIAEELAEAGYDTGFFGKWHLAGEGSIHTKDGIVNADYHPDKQGFDINIGGNAYGQPKSYFSPYKSGTLNDGPDGEYLTDRLTTEAIDFMKSHNDDPFFCYLSYYTVHTPYRAPKGLVDDNDGNVYHAMINCLDNNVGRLVDYLTKNNLLENTLIVFYADNGGLQANPPLRARKGSLYEGGIRVPLFFSWKGHIKAGKQNSTPVTSVDMFPTLLDIANVNTDVKGIEGKSLAPVLLQGEALDERPLFWHFPHHRSEDGAMGAAVRKGEWKLIYEFEKDRYQLFNLNKDVSETTDLLSKYPKKAKELRKDLERWQKKIDAEMPLPNPDFQVNNK
ncbi:sulfatase [Puteibacter caeruleilacunae]|nr:sulfatase [Puteibacter caeruleilacunae]